MVASITADQISDEQMARYIAMIYERTGIQISPAKKALVSNRLRKRMKANSVGCYDEYFALLKRCRQSDLEWQQFLQEITTHETYLFRDQAQWDWFRKVYLPEFKKSVLADRKTKSLRIWSAACSTGDEPYTIATCIAASRLFDTSWKIEVMATDIGIGALEAARKAVFNQRAMKNVPADLRARYFLSRSDGLWTPRNELTKLIEFKQHNLMQPLSVSPFDLIIIKNVLIYFDVTSKKKVLSNIDRVLKPEGKLLSGPAEGISDLVGKYEREKTWLHCKTAKSQLNPVGAK